MATVQQYPTQYNYTVYILYILYRILNKILIIHLNVINDIYIYTIESKARVEGVIVKPWAHAVDFIHFPRRNEKTTRRQQHRS